MLNEKNLAINTKSCHRNEMKEKFTDDYVYRDDIQAYVDANNNVYDFIEGQFKQRFEQ